MAQQRKRQGLRFSLPWLTAEPAPRPTPLQPPPAKTRSTPAQKQPSRSVAAQNFNQQQAPPPAQASPQNNTQKQSPSRATTKPQVTSQSSTPSRATPRSSRSDAKPPSPLSTTQSREATPPPSPSRVARKPLATTQPPSASRITSQAGSIPLSASPSRTISKTQPPSPTTLQPKASLKISSQPPVQRDAPPSSSFREAIREQTVAGLTNQRSDLPISTKEEETEPTRSKPEPNEDEAKQPRLALESPVLSTQNSDSSHIITDSNCLIESDEKLEETIKGKEIAQEPENENMVDAEQKQQEEEEIIHRKDTLAPSSSTKEQTKTVISDLKDKDVVHILNVERAHHHNVDGNTSKLSHEKHAISRERSPLIEESRDGISKLVHKMSTEHPNLLVDEKKVSIVTLAGENRGASMQLGFEMGKRDGAVHIRRRYKINPDESKETATDGEESSKECKNSKDLKSEEDKTTKPYINSNIQGINNSIMFHSSVTERDPGVHLTLSRNITKHADTIERRETPGAHKAEFNVTPAQNVSYKPSIRRRCLRGLFAEPSDSDPDNPDKPRHHGCHYRCNKKTNEKNMDK